MSAKTVPMQKDVATWISEIEPLRRREEAPILDALFRKASGFEPKVWNGGIVGYGYYDYTYDSGRSGRSLATGFAPRKAKISVYIMPGYTDFDPILERLGKHKKGAACLYINKLADIDLDVLGELIEAGLADLAKRWPISR